MDFEWSQEQQELYERVVAFARNRLPVVDKDDRFDPERFRQYWTRCAEHGIQGSVIPEEYGGLGLDTLSVARVMEAFGYGCHDMGLVFSIAAHMSACAVPIVRFGSEQLRQAILPQLAEGKLIAAHAATEPSSGSDVFSMRTRAERCGDEYLLNGSKCFATNAPCADVLVVFAVTKAKGGLFGISAFVVDREWPGVEVSRPYEKTGLHGSPLGDVFLADCRVPVERRIGREGEGARIFVHAMNWERVWIMCAYLGTMHRQLEEVIEYARNREQFGRPIKDFQAVSHKIVDMKTRLECARLIGYQAAWLLDRKRPTSISTESAIAKLVISEAAVQSGLDAMQVHGGLGVMAESGVERYLRDALPSRIYSGTSDILRNTIASGLGL